MGLEAGGFYGCKLITLEEREGEGFNYRVMKTRNEIQRSTSLVIAPGRHQPPGRREENISNK